MGEAAVAAAAVEAVSNAISLGMKTLDSISEHYYENEGIIAWWNDWKSRDQRARIEKTYTHGRFSREKRTLGIVNGRWYCCFTQTGLRAKGQPLDA